MAVKDVFGSGGLAVGSPGQASDGFTSSGLFGRWLNNITGKTAENDFNAQEAEKARLFNSSEAQKVRDWETMMSNTSYQRAKSDMLAAGINPASLGGNAAGSAASTPSGPSASGVAAHASGSGNGSIIGSVVSAIVGGIGMAAKNAISRSALSNKEGYLDLKKIETQSKVALNAARKVDYDVTSSNKEYNRKWKQEKWENHLKKLEAEKARHEDPSEISDEEIDALFADLGLDSRRRKG